MSHIDIYKHFKTLFPEKVEKSVEYFPNGKNSIRVRYLDKSELIFTLNSISDWKLETIKSFLKSYENN